MLTTLQRRIVGEIAEFFELASDERTLIEVRQVRRTDFIVSYDGFKAGRNWPYSYIHGTGAMRGVLFQRESDSTLLVRMVRNPGI